MDAAQLEANKQLVRRLFEEVFNRGDLEAAAALVHLDYLQHSPLAAPGLSGLRAFVGELRKAFPDLRMTIEDLIAEGDKVVARMTGAGTHSGEFLGIAATGRPVRVASIDIFRVRAAKLAEHWDVLDVAGLMAQLGPAPGR